MIEYNANGDFIETVEDKVIFYSRPRQEEPIPGNEVFRIYGPMLMILSGIITTMGVAELIMFLSKLINAATVLLVVGKIQNLLEVIK